MRITSKSQLLEAIQVERAKLEKKIAGLSPQELVYPACMDTWSVKDILAHLSAWEAELVKLLWQASFGKKPNTVHFDSERDVDAMNLSWYNERKERPLEAVLEDLHAVRKQTLRRVAEFTDKELNDPEAFTWLRGYPLWEWIASDSFKHVPEHTAQIQAWRQARGL